MSNFKCGNKLGELKTITRGLEHTNSWLQVLVFLPLGFRSFLFLYFLLALWYFQGDTRLRGHIPSFWCCLAYLYVLTINFLWQRRNQPWHFPIFSRLLKTDNSLELPTAQKNLLFFLKLQSYMYFKLKLCELRECLMTPKIPNWSWSKYLCPPKQIVKYKTQSIVFRLFHHPRRAAQWHLRKCSEGPCCSLAQICCPQPQTVSLENWKHCWTLLHKA